MNKQVSCRICKNFLELKEPFHYKANGYHDGVTVFGICSKDSGRHSFHPVYIVDGGSCKGFKKKPGEKIPVQHNDMQISMEEYHE